MMKFLIVFLSFILLAGHEAGAQEYKIAAVVNGDEISSYTLEKRVDLAIRSSGLPNTKEVRDKVRQQVLEILIDEDLKEQEAARLKLEINDSDLQEAISQIEKQNKLEPGGFDGFLAREELPKDSVLAQIKSQIAWRKVVLEKIRPKIAVSENAVKDQMEVMINQTGKKQYDLSEIVLKIDDPAKEPEVKSLAMKLAAEIKSGAGDFAGIAKQFSSGEFSAAGGEMGLVSPDQLDKKTAKLIGKLRVGDITEPVHSDKGYEIFRLNKIKNFVIKDPSESEVSLKQISIPLDRHSDPEQGALAEEKLNTISKQIGDCGNYDKVAAAAAKNKQEKITFRDFGHLQIKNLAPEIRPVIADLRPGEPSPVLRNSSALSIFLVCERIDPAGSEIAIEPDTNEINEMLLEQKIDLEARKYIKRLRAEAYIEKRI